MIDYSNPKLLVESAKLSKGQVTWKSPSNLAIVKYWGKHGIQLPRNPSISMTLNNAHTITRVSYEARTDFERLFEIDFMFHGERMESFEGKISKFFEQLLPIYPFLKQVKWTIESENSFPHSAGIASSASAMSALALCLCSVEDELFGTLSDDKAFDQKASYLARLGSGSASRSVYSKWSVWGQSGSVEGSSDEFAIAYDTMVHPVFNTFHDDILIVSRAEKSVSSTAGHQLMEGNPFAAVRYQQANKRLEDLCVSMKKGDVEHFGKIAEDEALTLHALMMASNPSYLLVEPGSIEMIKRIRAFRADTKHPVYFSLDAGPNIHLLYPEEIVHVVRPFVETELAPLCVDGFWINDWCGDGPEQL